MKRILIILLMAVSLVAMQSCKDAKFGIAYSISAIGDANGDVEVTFPNGDFASQGTAAIAFKWSNDTTKFESAQKIVSLDDAKYINDDDIVKAANVVEEWLNDNFSVSSADGDYYVHVTGYVEETLTQVKLSIDREFTNRK